MGKGKAILLGIFTVSILLFQAAGAADDSLFYTDSLMLTTELSSSLHLSPRTSESEVEYVIANLYFYPRADDRQEVLSLSTKPEATRAGDYLLFRWDKPREESLTYSVESETLTYNRFMPVKTKVLFPVSNIPQEYVEYTKPTKLIDINPDIIDRATQLAEGETDEYVIVFKAADWVKSNVKYDLNTLTAEAAQPASWVLKNKEGVCDEITTLFIALLRSLKIPARFVSGISYTNSELFPEPWGLHGWAEVYFPGYGWVPFDVTYGQFGFIDAAHVKLLDSNDAGKSSSKFEWKAVETDLTASQLEMQTTIVKKGQPLDELFDMDISFFSSNVGFGSYDLAIVTLTNRQDYYVTTELSLSKPKEVTVVGEQRKMVMLKPRAQKKIVWLLKVDEGLRQGYAYTFPIVVQTQRNLMAREDFKATDGKIVFSLKDMQKVQNELVDEEKKEYSKNIAFSCSAPSEKILANTTFVVNCTVQNTGNINLGDITYCVDGSSCTVSSLGIAQSQELFFNESFDSLGEKSVRVSAESPEVTAASYLKMWAMDKPRLSIDDVEHPVQVAYDDEFSVEFKVMRESMSEPRDVMVFFSYGFESQEWKIDSLDQYQPFKVSVSGSMLNLDRNRFIINTTYKDDSGERYSTINDFYITLKEPTLWQKIKIFFNSLGRQILGIFPAKA